jgi:hypothetical protein
MALLKESREFQNLWLEFTKIQVPKKNQQVYCLECQKKKNSKIEPFLKGSIFEFLLFFLYFI